jgi:hypothetical protein
MRAKNMPTSPEPSEPERKRVRGPIVLIGLLALGAILIGIVVLAATGGRAPKFHAPHVLPS